MKRTLLAIAISWLILIATGITDRVMAEENKYSVWVGNHYTEFSDYRKKVGEFMLGENKWRPEFRFDQFSRSGGSTFEISSHYFDPKNAFGRVQTTGDRLKGVFQYRSFNRQYGQDMLTNLETREWQSTRPGGKILTHELLDSGVAYDVHRQEVLSRISVLLSEKQNVHMQMSHRMILQEGQKQSTSSSHCYSCHIVSQTAKVDRTTQEFEAEIRKEWGAKSLGYQFGLRTFSSHASNPYMSYDPGKHPVNGSSGAEFSSRLNFDDTTAAVGVLPKTRKVSHKMKAKTSLAGGTVSGSVSISRAENRDTELNSDIYSGAITYSRTLSPRSRVVAKISGTKQNVDDPFIDLPTYRDGRPGPTVNFDYTRYSTLDRKEGKASVEYSTRIDQKTSLSVFAGYQRTERDNYPEKDSGLTTSQLIGQARVKYRAGSKLSGSMLYRFEKTSDPFTSGRGLFEARGRETIKQLAPGFAFLFYFQREALRYQTITTMPTDEHDIQLSVSSVPSSWMSIQLGLNGRFDKNGDLDSLDVKHASLQPSFGVTMTPNSQWTVNAGVSYAYDKSRLPVTMPLFDG